MVSTTEKMHHSKRLLSQLKNFLYDFVFGIYTQAVVAEDETVWPQGKSFINNFRSTTFGENSVSHVQVIGKKMSDRHRKEIDRVVAAVETWDFDAILTSMVRVVIPRVEMAMRSITGFGSSGRGPCSVVQNSDRRDFLGNMEDTPLMTACYRADLNINDRIDETRNIENTEDGNSPALKFAVAGTRTLIILAEFGFFWK